jgi:hypothetical protein
MRPGPVNRDAHLPNTAGQGLHANDKLSHAGISQGQNAAQGTRTGANGYENAGRANPTVNNGRELGAGANSQLHGTAASENARVGGTLPQHESSTPNGQNVSQNQIGRPMENSHSPAQTTPTTSTGHPASQNVVRQPQQYQQQQQYQQPQQYQQQQTQTRNSYADPSRVTPQYQTPNRNAGAVGGGAAPEPGGAQAQPRQFQASESSRPEVGQAPQHYASQPAAGNAQSQAQAQVPAQSQTHNQGNSANNSSNNGNKQNQNKQNQ